LKKIWWVGAMDGLLMVIKHLDQSLVGSLDDFYAFGSIVR